MEVPRPEQFGLTLEQIHRTEDRVWRFQLLAAVVVGIAGGVVGFGLIRGFLIARGSRDIQFDSLMMALPLAIFLGIASGMACLILLLNLPFPLGKGHALARRYRTAVAQFRQQLNQTHHQQWDGLADRQLLDRVSDLYRRLGYDVLRPPASETDSVDLLLRKEDTTALVNCRRQEGPVDWRAVRTVSEAQARLEADRALVISVPGFTPRARRFATNKPIGLLSVRELANMQLHLESQAGTEAETSVPLEK